MSAKIRTTYLIDSKRKESGINDSDKQHKSTKGNGIETSINRSGQKNVLQKRPSPFRIKPGCVVALRFRTEGNAIELSTCSKRKRNEIQTINFDDSFLQVWVDPFPGRDERFALIGKRIRCFFPKLEGISKRVLEGEILSLPGFRETNRGPFNAELLIDRPLLEHFNFLSRMDEDVDITKLTNETARRNQRLEEQIRGKNKVTVKVKLENPFSFGNPSNKAVRWVMLKRVPPTLFPKPASTKKKSSGKDIESSDDRIQTEDTENGSKYNNNLTKLEGNGTSSKLRPPTTDSNPPQKKRRRVNAGVSGSLPAAVATRYCGDGNDSADQQLSNWRWLSGRYYDLLLSSSSRNGRLQLDGTISTVMDSIISGGLVGKVLNVNPSSSGNSLATVTIKRLILPEQTMAGRLPSHRLNDIFEPYSNTTQNQEQEILEIRVPVEHLVIVSHKPPLEVAPFDEPDRFVVSHAYNVHDNVYFPIQEKGELFNIEDSIPTLDTPTNNPTIILEHCHRCRNYMEDLRICRESNDCLRYNPENGAARWCRNCIRTLTLGTDFEDDLDGCYEGDEGEYDLPCCTGLCDCRMCSICTGWELQEELMGAVTSSCNPKLFSAYVPSPFHFAATMMKSSESSDFWLPNDFMEVHVLPMPRGKPTTKVRPRKMKRPLNLKLARMKKIVDKSQPNSMTTLDIEIPAETEDYGIFKPTCARVESRHDSRLQIQKKANGTFASTQYDMTRNIRELMSKGTKGKNTELEKENERINSSRAARANQRRLMKDVASFGSTAVASFGLIDSLSNREPQLRFGRSSIHAWGVYAEADIAADEMIVEYRGELIGNAVAEKREKEYEAAKIGSDYMFRIDSDSVCDATKQGNVARFINASCDPNCYTKIILLDGTKRIVIYAKRDINAGEELCYDYKFPLEYDETKRIPCHCGARDCRGFMNWDKRYIAIKEPGPELGPDKN